jgi:hypothetical protein
MDDVTMNNLTRVPLLLHNFHKHLGEVNVNFCAIDAALTEALHQARSTSKPELQLQQWAAKKNYHLHFKAVPELHQPLGLYGIVFLHQVMETLYDSIDDYAKSRGLFKSFDPEGSDNSPKGEDMLRKLVRKLNLAKSGAQEMPNYKKESSDDRDKREAEFRNTIGCIEALLMDYFRLLRNAAVHANAMSVAFKCYEEDVVQELAKIEKNYRIHPSIPSDVSVTDMILCSKVLQNVARRLCIMVRPNVKDEILPHLQARFARYNNPVRQRNAIIGALCTDYLLALSEAEVYV